MESFQIVTTKSGTQFYLLTCAAYKINCGKQIKLHMGATECDLEDIYGWRRCGGEYFCEEHNPLSPRPNQ